MRPPFSVQIEDDLCVAFELMHAEGVRELAVLDAVGAVIGFIDETVIAAAFLRATGRRPAEPDGHRGVRRPEGES